MCMYSVFYSVYSVYSVIIVEMVQCFVPDCCHHSGVHQCRFHRFPSSVAAKRRWIGYIR